SSRALPYVYGGRNPALSYPYDNVRSEKEALSYPYDITPSAAIHPTLAWMSYPYDMGHAFVSYPYDKQFSTLSYPYDRSEWPPGWVLPDVVGLRHQRTPLPPRPLPPKTQIKPNPPPGGFFYAWRKVHEKYVLPEMAEKPDISQG